MTAPAAFRTRLRRYPALGFLAVAALLASLLPSALRVPLSGPTASAELAPVPGKSDSAQGDLSALGETSTGGLGSGEGSGLDGIGLPGRSGGGSAVPDTGSSGLPGSGRNPSDKKCVGNPPRQTEDPLSPPCVAYFKGDNGGATTKGVTRDEIRVVMYTGCSSSPTSTEYSDPDAQGVDRSVAAYLRYFNARFQTYGRRVRLWRASAPCGTPSAIVAYLDEQFDPFAILPPTNINWSDTAAEEAAERGILSVLDHGSRPLMHRRAPYVISYPPDLEGHAETTAQFVCSRLAGRPARFAGDVSMHATTRKFALVYEEYADTANRGADLIVDGVRKRCGPTAGEVEVFFNSFVSRSDQQAQAIARMRTRGVTTLIFTGDEQTFAFQADAQKWYPEWLHTSSTLSTDNSTRFFWPPGELAGSIGFTVARRLEDRDQMIWTTTAQEGCDCRVNGREQDYNHMLLLFTGIQAAGPNLTAANVDKGLHAIPPRPSPDPRVPAAYFAPGNYSFIKDAAALRWDPTGTRPGNQGTGCWRLAEGGKRYRAQDWADNPGDAMLTADGQPCQGDAGGADTSGVR